MNKEELAELISDCSTLYHMAEDGSWPSIKKQGLLSTAALLDKYGVTGAKRQSIERTRRSESVRVEGAQLPAVIIRDQLPMDDVGLRRALPENVTPADWYELLNRKVFFWLSRDRLTTLMSARAYRDRPQDILEVDTASLIAAYTEKIWFCPINSGCTKPFPHPRTPAVFSRIGDYPYERWRACRRKGERVVELAIDYAVPDIRQYVKRVTSMQAGKVLKQIL